MGTVHINLGRIVSKAIFIKKPDIPTLFYQNKMNSKAFLALFFNAAILAGVNGLGSFTTVAYNGALSIPLLAATSGTFGTAIAVLGLLKLGAAALILAGSAAEEPAAEGYGYKRRHQRSATMASSPDGLFALIRSMDMYECGKSLVCELEAKKEGELLEDETLIMSLFSDRKGKNKFVNPGSAKAEYDLAAELGLATKDQVICRQRYASCPYTAEEMMKALRQAHL